MKPSKPIPRISAKKIKALNGKPIPFSSITKPSKAIRKRNPERQAKRKAGYRKLLSGKEYKAARAEAFARSGNQCEQTDVPTLRWSPESGLYEMPMRCFATEGLHAHHLRYPKSRPLEARDLLVCCKPHHEYLESLKMHKSRMF